MSKSVQMFGWFNEATARASRSKRARRSSRLAICSGNTLTATVRSSLVSRARYTSPMPPAPMGARISYGPTLSPGRSGIKQFNKCTRSGNRPSHPAGRSPAVNSRQRVAPLQAGESREVAIGGTQFRPVFKSQSSQVSVGREIPAGTHSQEQLAKNVQVARTGMDDCHGRLIQPGSHQIKSCLDRQRAPEQAGPGREPEEGENYIPWKSDGFPPGQNRFQPRLCLPVQYGVRVDRIDQKVRIQKNHLRNVSFRLSSWSSIASAAASALSQRNSCSCPIRN